jgi:[ribosomal protein S5]-alanine N-acetyltransferase
VDRVSDGAFIGWCSLNRWNPGYRSASLGYCFDDAAWVYGLIRREWRPSSEPVADR